MAPGKKCLVAPQAAAFCVTVAGVAQWLCLLQIDGGGWYWLWAPSKILTDGKNLLTFCLTRLVASRQVPELRHHIRIDELAKKTVRKELWRERSGSVSLWHCVFSHVNSLKNLNCGCDCLC